MLSKRLGVQFLTTYNTTQNIFKPSRVCHVAFFYLMMWHYYRLFVNCWKLINLPKTNDYTYRLYNNKNTKHKAELGFYLNSPQHDLWLTCFFIFNLTEPRYEIRFFKGHVHSLLVKNRVTRSYNCHR